MKKILLSALAILLSASAIAADKPATKALNEISKSWYIQKKSNFEPRLITVGTNINANVVIVVNEDTWVEGMMERVKSDSVTVQCNDDKITIKAGDSAVCRILTSSANRTITINDAEKKNGVEGTYYIAFAKAPQ